MITFEKLKEMNASGELPKQFTDEELQKIVEAESMACLGGCAFCPMAQYEFGYTPQPQQQENKQEDKKEDK